MQQATAKTIKPVTSIAFRRSCLIAMLIGVVLTGGCSNFGQRERYWNQQLAGALKGADVYTLKSFAAANGHEVHCDGGGGQGSDPVSECYFVDAKSKGALLNYRGRLFVMIKMTDGRANYHTFTKTTVLY